MRENKSKALVVSLVVVSTLLLGLVMYMFVIRPTFTGYVTRQQTYGYQVGYAEAITQVMQQAAQCQQPVPLTSGETTMNMIWIDCLPPELFQQQAP